MKKKKPRKALMTLITVLIILLVAAIIYFCLAGFSFGIYKVDPIPEQVNLGLDLTGGVYAVYQADQGDLDSAVFAAKIDATMGALRTRLDKKGFTEATVVAQGSDRIRVEVPINDTSEMSDPSKILEFLGKPAKLEFLDANGDVAITGDMVKKSGVSTIQNDFGVTQYVVSLEFNSEGADIFERITGEAYEKGITIPIMLDEEVISDPIVKSGAISGGNAIIEGGDDWTAEDASNLAIQIESGALPLNLNETEVRSINALLGDEALNKSLFAGLIGLCVLFLFMIIYYRLPGIVACIALSFYLFIVVFLLAAIPQIQLTLPGIAGIILGIGMAVDANVIIFERFKEELAVGKTLRSSLNSGFSKALWTIIDSNVTTFIAALVIALFGVGTVKGFGYTLMISIAVSMFTALVITRQLLKFIIYLNIKNTKLYSIKKPLSKPLPESGVKGVSNMKFMNKSKYFMYLSAAIVLVGLIVGIISGGLNLGIDFTGGSILTVELGEQYDMAVVEQALEANGIDASMRQLVSGGADNTQAIIRMQELPENVDDATVREAIISKLRETYPNAQGGEVESVGGVTTGEIVRNAFLAIIIAAAFMLVYIWIRFELFSGIAALTALIHDVLIMTAVMSIARVQINSSYIAACLTIVGYSINDTIVLFDRIRENNKRYSISSKTRAEVADISIRETLSRTINTSVTTLVMVLALYIFGVDSIKEFALPLIVGLISGTYSSIFIASPVWVRLMHAKHKKEYKKLTEKNAKAK